MSKIKTYYAESCDTSFMGTSEEVFRASWNFPEHFSYGTRYSKCLIASSTWRSRMVAAKYVKESE